MGEGINFSSAKQFLLSTGLRASADSANAIQTAINEYATDLAEKSKKIAESKNRKTITEEHVNAAKAAESDDEEDNGED